VLRLVAVPASQVLAVRERARLDARAALTARMGELPCWGGLATQACRWSAAAAVDEWTDLTLVSVRLAAHALGADPAALLGALLTTRTAAEYEQGGEA
jgi:hypothetical protein